MNRSRKFHITVGLLALVTVGNAHARKHKIPNMKFKNSSSNTFVVSRVLYFNTLPKSKKQIHPEEDGLRKIGASFVPNWQDYYWTLEKNKKMPGEWIKRIHLNKGLNEISFSSDKQSLYNFYYKVGFFTFQGHNIAKTDHWLGTSIVLDEYSNGPGAHNDMYLEIPATMREAATLEFTRKEWNSVIHLKRGEAIEFSKPVVIYSQKYIADPYAYIKSLKADKNGNPSNLGESELAIRNEAIQKEIDELGKNGGGERWSSGDAVYRTRKMSFDETLNKLAGKSFKILCSNNLSVINCELSDLKKLVK